jgi:predicted lipoprotein with Yx(FWY)xxD motif
MTFRHHRIKSFGAFAAAGVAALALIIGGCGDDDDDNGDGDGAAPTATTQAASSPAPEASPTTEAASSPSAGGIATIVTAEAGELGTILTTLDGYTLYFFANDVAGSGASACEGGCAAAWPPLPVAGAPTGGEGVTGELGTITRPDGLTQVTYDGKPLYMFANDASPGDTNGKDVPNWSVATP